MPRYKGKPRPGAAGATQRRHAAMGPEAAQALRASRARDRAAKARAEGGAMTETIRFAVRRTGSGFEGEVILPIGATDAAGFARHRVHVTAKGPTRESALSKAAGVADQIAQNPIVQAALPPGSGAAVSALKYLSKTGIDKGMKKIVGAGAKRLAKALKFW